MCLHQHPRNTIGMGSIAFDSSINKDVTILEHISMVYVRFSVISMTFIPVRVYHAHMYFELPIMITKKRLIVCVVVGQFQQCLLSGFQFSYTRSALLKHFKSLRPVHFSIILSWMCFYSRRQQQSQHESLPGPMTRFLVTKLDITRGSPVPIRHILLFPSLI